MGYYERSYGHAGAVAAALTAIAFLIADNKCTIERDLQTINWVVIVVGIVLFSLSFFALANTLYEVKLLFFCAVIGLIVTSVAAIYGAYLATTAKCGGNYGSNVFSSRDITGIIVFLLNLFGALFMVSATGAFGRRWEL